MTSVRSGNRKDSAFVAVRADPIRTNPTIWSRKVEPNTSAAPSWNRRRSSPAFSARSRAATASELSHPRPSAQTIAASDLNAVESRAARCFRPCCQSVVVPVMGSWPRVQRSRWVCSSAWPRWCRSKAWPAWSIQCARNQTRPSGRSSGPSASCMTSRMRSRLMSSTGARADGTWSPPCPPCGGPMVSSANGSSWPSDADRSTRTADPPAVPEAVPLVAPPGARAAANAQLCAATARSVGTVR